MKRRRQLSEQKLLLLWKRKKELESYVKISQKNKSGKEKVRLKRLIQILKGSMTFTMMKQTFWNLLFKSFGIRTDKLIWRKIGSISFKRIGMNNSYIIEKCWTINRQCLIRRQKLLYIRWDVFFLPYRFDGNSYGYYTDNYALLSSVCLSRSYQIIMHGDTAQDEYKRGIKELGAGDFYCTLIALFFSFS